MDSTRRSFMGTFGTATLLAGVGPVLSARAQSYSDNSLRRFSFVQMDVFTSRRLQGNPLSVFLDARGLSDSEMQDLARETNLQETTFIFPTDPEIARHDGIKVRIFAPEGELPFAGHPALGTASVLRNLRRTKNLAMPDSTITLALKIGQVPVSFTEDAEGSFGEMRQPEPVFSDVYNLNSVAATLGLRPGQIEDGLPIQTVSTGLPYVIVRIKDLSTLQNLKVDLQKVSAYLKWDTSNRRDFYYVTRDTRDPKVGLRARAIFETGEDPATGSAAGCTAAWMAKYRVFSAENTVLIRQGVEIKRPSDLFVKAGRTGDTVTNVRVGGYAVQVMQGELLL